MKKLGFFVTLCLLFCTIGFAALAGTYNEPINAEDVGQTYIEAALELVEKGLVIIHEPEKGSRDIAKPCDMPGCSGTIRQIRTSSTFWKNTGNTVDCKVNWKMKDVIQKRTVTTEFQCSKCGYGFDHTYTEDREYCEH